MSRTVADTKEQAKNKRLAADENGMLELGTLGAAGESRILWKKKIGLGVSWGKMIPKNGLHVVSAYLETRNDDIPHAPSAPTHGPRPPRQ